MTGLRAKTAFGCALWVCTLGLLDIEIGGPKWKLRLSSWLHCFKKPQKQEEGGKHAG